MFATRGHARTTLFSRAGRCLVAHAQRATARTQATIRPEMVPQNDIAQKLAKDGAWVAARSGKRKGKNTDRYRVNIVGEELCDDVLKYIKPSLARHEGCDLIDIFPGVGTWSQKLNEVLKPRSHLLLEPDEDFYRPFLEPLLERPGTRLMPESGIVWEQLNKILNPAVLPHQVERKYRADETPPRNDTLLVTMNLSMYPTRKFRTFDSLSQLVLFQLMSSIRPGALFHKYGLVRMLIWMPDSEKGSVLPRTVQQRKKMAFEAEMATDYVCEVAGGEDESAAAPTHWFRRDESIDFESTKATLERMRQTGYVMPPGREPYHLQEFLKYTKLHRKATMDSKHSIDRPFMAELETLEEEFADGKFEKGSQKYTRLKTLEYLRGYTARRSSTVVDLIQERDAAIQAYLKAGSDEKKLKKATVACHEWCNKVKNLESSLRAEILLQRDNLHVLRQDPPVLNWDRRYVEPLRARTDEFFPRIPCALLDIQPKAVAPVLRDMGPDSTRGGDYFDLVLRGLTRRSVEPVSKSLDTIYAGAGDGVAPHCPSLFDPRVGGSPMPGIGELATRALNQRQLIEITQAWMRWPFRPQYSELVSRTIEDFTDEETEDIMGNAASVE
jgi:hypothetical protein